MKQYYFIKLEERNIQLGQERYSSWTGVVESSNPLIAIDIAKKLASEGTTPEAGYFVEYIKKL